MRHTDIRDRQEALFSHIELQHPSHYQAVLGLASNALEVYRIEAGKKVASAEMIVNIELGAHAAPIR